MKKDSIAKMLKTLKSKATAVNVSIIEMLLLKENLGGAKKQALTDVLSKDFPKRRVQSALLSLRKKGITLEITGKGSTKVGLTPNAVIELLGAETGKKTAQLLSETEKLLKDVTALAKTECGKMKKKALKKLDKGVAYMKDLLREVTK